MNHSIIRYGLIALLVGIVALSTVPAQAQTEQMRQITIVHDLAPVGLAYGQSLRINVLNPLEPSPPGEDGRKYKMLFAVTLFTADGSVIARSDEITLDPKGFHSFDFNRADLSLAGEAGTGRLQVRAEIQRRFFSGIVARLPQGASFGTGELMDSGTGKTLAAIWLAGQAAISDQINGQYLITGVSHSGVGLVPGQTLRLNIFNPHDEDKGRTSIKTVAVRVNLFDARGNLIAQSAEVTIPAGQFHSFDFNRNALPLAGEPGTGRVQTRAQVRYRSFYLVDRTRAVGFSHTSLELIDSSTGRTTAVWLTVGFFEVVPPQNP